MAIPSSPSPLDSVGFSVLITHRLDLKLGFRPTKISGLTKGTHIRGVGRSDRTVTDTGPRLDVTPASRGKRTGTTDLSENTESVLVPCPSVTPSVTPDGGPTGHRLEQVFGDDRRGLDSRGLEGSRRVGTEVEDLPTPGLWG